MSPTARIIYIIAFIVFSYLSVNYFKTAIEDKLIIKNGNSHIVEILTMPNCGRSSCRVEVAFNSKKYFVDIGVNRCTNGECGPGKQIEVIYSTLHDKMILPTRPVQAIYWISIGFFFVPLYCLFRVIKSLRSGD